MKTMQVVLATSNPGKIAELAQALAPLGLEVLPLTDFPDLPQIKENGETFAANALLKAQAVANATGHVAIADDSGLMVDILDGAPGVYSARYGDDWEAQRGETRDQRNIRKLLYAMRPYDIGDRVCHFVCAIAAAAPTGEELVCEGTWFGTVLEAPLGTNGFGYDPVFWDVAAKKSAAEMNREEKNAVSHRGKAIRALIAEWPAFMELIQADR